MGGMGGRCRGRGGRSGGGRGRNSLRKINGAEFSINCHAFVKGDGGDHEGDRMNAGIALLWGYGDMEGYRVWG